MLAGLSLDLVEKTRGWPPEAKLIAFQCAAREVSEQLYALTIHEIQLELDALNVGRPGPHPP